MKRLFSVLLFVLGLLYIGAQEQLTNLPTIYITTDGGASINSKDTYVPGKVTIITDVEADAIADKTMGIRGRGNSTWGMPKKPYRIKFDKKINLFNRPAKAKSWVLLANYADKTLMRNALAFEISRILGFEFTPSTIFADVVLNGKYVGNYMVTDQMEVNSGRVEIDEMDETCLEGDELTGGYFLELDGFATSEPVWFKTKQGIMVTVKSPDDDVIKPVQLQYITDFIQGFENVLFSDKFKDPEKGYRAWVDERSLINWYIACELTGNSDSFWSTYCYKKRGDDHLYFGPLWDYDIAFNNDARLGDATYKLMRESAHNPKVWIQKIWQDPWFRKAVNDRWKELLEQDDIQHLLLQYIENTAKLIDASQKRNFEKWPVLNTKVYNELQVFKTYAEGVDFLRNYVESRINFLTESFAATGELPAPIVFDENKKYKIRHSSGNYMTFANGNVLIMSEQGGEEQQFTLKESGFEGIYNIIACNGSYVGSNTQWDTKMLTDPNDPYAQYSVERSSYTGYLKIKNMGRGKFLGTDADASGSFIYTDKSGNSLKHAWTIQAVEIPMDYSRLQEAIKEAQDCLDNTEPGVMLGNYPQEAVDALTLAIADANAMLENAKSQEEVDNAEMQIRQSLADYQQSVITDKHYWIDKATIYNIWHAASGLVLDINENKEAALQRYTGVQTQCYRMLDAGDGALNIQTCDDEGFISLLGGWNTTLTYDAAASETLFEIDFVERDAEKSYVRIHRYGENRGLGTDRLTEGSLVYTDKTDGEKSLWYISAWDGTTNEIADISDDASSVVFENGILTLCGFQVDQVQLYDLLGNKMLEATKCDKLDISDLSDGMYIIRIVSGYNQKIVKILKTT